MCNFGMFAKRVIKEGKWTYECTPFGPGEMAELSDEDKAMNYRITTLNLMIAGMWAIAIFAAATGVAAIAIRKHRRTARLSDANYVLLG